MPIENEPNNTSGNSKNLGEIRGISFAKFAKDPGITIEAAVQSRFNGGLQERERKQSPEPRRAVFEVARMNGDNDPGRTMKETQRGV